jgi:hypothetical protein
MQIILYTQTYPKTKANQQRGRVKNRRGEGMRNTREINLQNREENQREFVRLEVGTVVLAASAAMVATRRVATRERR